MPPTGIYSLPACDWLVGVRCGDSFGVASAHIALGVVSTGVGSTLLTNFKARVERLRLLPAVALADRLLMTVLPSFLETNG
eukprot:6447573-Pyramimonas_sp.AAC.1